MKVVFIQPYYHNIWEALGIGYIASYIRKNFKGELQLKFYQAYFDDDKTIIDGCSDSDIIGISTTSPNFKHGVKLSREIKKINPNVHIVFGGWHVTALKEKSFVEGIDQIVIGEGEKAFLSILEGNRQPVLYGTKLPWPELPWPDRDLIRVDRTINLCERMTGKRITSFQANRGCPMRCRFCSERIITGNINKKNPVRTRDVQDILKEIKEISEKYNLDMIKFCDATFDISSDFVISFCKEKISMGVDIEWEAMVHAALVKEEMFDWLKKANCNQIDVGCESGSDKVLKQMRKGTNTQKIRNVFRWAKDVGLQRRAFFLIGMPEEDIEDIMKTKHFMFELDAEHIGVTMLCPYPGSYFYDYNSMKDIDWSKTDEYGNDFWSTRYFTNEGLKNIQKYLLKKINQSTIVERQNR